MPYDPLATLASTDAMPGQPEMGAPYTPPPPPVETVQPDYSATIPSETAPNNPDIERHFHESTWHRILDSVGSILGGDTTMNVTRSPDGQITITHDPSTTGEKWGRIAATALGGAAQGLANSRGPGGLARATAAGTGFGLQVPQQRRNAVEDQATAEQKIQQTNASGALIQQNLYRGTLEAQALNTRLSKDQGELLNAYKDSLASSPYAKDYGTIGSEADLMRVARENQEFLNQHARLQLKAIPVPDGKGGVTLHAVATDPGDDMQPTKDGDYLFVPDIDDKGQRTLRKEPVSPGSRKAGELRLANQAQMEKFLTGLNDDHKANKPAPTRAPTLAELAMTAATDPDPAKRAAAQKAVDIYKEKPGTGTETEGNPLLPTQRGASNAELPDESTFQGQFISKPSPAGQKILDTLPSGTANLVQRFGNYLADEGKELPRGKERGPFLELVSTVYPNFDSAHYEARRDTVKSLEGDGKIAQSRNALNLAIQHMGEMYNAMLAIDPGEYPLINKSSRTTHLTGGLGSKKVKEAYGSYNDANEGVSSEIARVFKGGAPTQTEVNQYRGNADPTAPRSTQLGSFKTRSHMLASRMATINRQLQESFGTPGKMYNLLTPEAVETLKRIPGGRAILQQAGYNAAAAPQATGGNAPATPGTPNNATAKAIPGATFDATIWHNVHPDKDLSAAIEKARKQGMNVINDPFGGK